MFLSSQSFVVLPLKGSSGVLIDSLCEADGPPVFAGSPPRLELSMQGSPDAGPALTDRGHGLRPFNCGPPRISYFVGSLPGWTLKPARTSTSFSLKKWDWGRRPAPSMTPPTDFGYRRWGIGRRMPAAGRSRSSYRAYWMAAAINSAIAFAPSSRGTSPNATTKAAFPLIFTHNWRASAPLLK